MRIRRTLFTPTQQYDLSIEYNAQQGTATFVVGYDLNAATGIARTGITINNDQVAIRPSSAPVRVATDYQGTGLGTALIQSTLQFASEQGAHTATASTQQDNHAALLSFEKNGFRKKGILHNGLVELVKELN